MAGTSPLILECEDLATSVPALHAARGAMADFFADDLPDARVARIWRGEVPPSPTEVSYVIVTGASAMVGDALPWIEEARAWLRVAIASNVPVLGICFGCQLLADMLGGVVAETSGGPEYGSVEVRLSTAGQDDPLTRGLPGRFPAQSSHLQSVVSLPPGAVVLARSGLAVQAIRFGERVWGVQFHPEFTQDDIRQIIGSARPALIGAGLDIEALIGGVRPAEEAGSIVRRFAVLAHEGKSA